MFLPHHWAGWKLVMEMDLKKEKKKAFPLMLLAKLAVLPIIFYHLHVGQSEQPFGCRLKTCSVYIYTWRCINMTEENPVHLGVHWGNDLVTIPANVAQTSHPVAMKALLSAHYCSENGLLSVAFVLNIPMSLLPLFSCHWINRLGAGEWHRLRCNPAG